MRNRQTLDTLLQQNPQASRVRFTCKAMITSVNENRRWKYATCSHISKASTEQNGTYTCDLDHLLITCEAMITSVNENRRWKYASGPIMSNVYSTELKMKTDVRSTQCVFN